jgi:hypothetical protein
MMMKRYTEAEIRQMPMDQRLAIASAAINSAAIWALVSLLASMGAAVISLLLN